MPHVPGKPRPNAWVHKDPLDHDRHHAWLRSKAQAHFRNEGWELTVQDFFDFWDPVRWPQRGRATHDLVMVRFDVDKPWSRSNCCIVERIIQLKISAGKKRNKDLEHLYQQGFTL